MRRKMKKIMIKLLLLSSLNFAQSPVIEKYIHEGLNNNLALKQKNSSLQKAFFALKEAKGLFFPTVDFKSEYEFSDGGRKINFPVGEMLNPVYSTLNQLTKSNVFPQIENQNIQLLPDNYHDTRIEIKMPLINTDIWYNNKIKDESVSQKEAEVNAYKRELVKEIKTAYYNYLKSVKAAAIYKNAASLLADNYKLTETLVKNNVVLKSSLLKISSEISKNEAQLTEAANCVKLSALYFNFLLNKEQSAPVEIDTAIFQIDKKRLTPADSLIYDVAGREELQQIKSGIKQNEFLLSMNKGEYIPSVGAFLSAGYQGTKYKFDSDQRYYLFGLQLNWNLFNGMRTKSKTEQTATDLSSLKSGLEETSKKLSLQLNSAQLDLNTAASKLNSAESALEYSQEYYRQMQARYSTGQALLLELTDALTQYVNNQIIYQVAFTDTLIKQAELERAAALYNFN
jgi:outer membrane protein